MSEPFALHVQAAPGVDTYALTQECRSLYLKGLAGIVRDGGVAGRPALEALVQGVGKFFDDMVATLRRAGFEQAKGLTASRISLVGDSQLELELRRDEIAAHLFDGCADSLWRLHLRLTSLLQRPGLDLRDNPVSPDGICQGLADMCDALGRPQDELLRLLDSVEEALSLRLPGLYGELSEFLSRQGVEAAQVQRNMVQPPTPGSARPPGADGAGRAGTADPLLALKDSLSGRPSGLDHPPLSLGGAPAAQPLDPDLLERLLERLKTLEAFTPTNPDLIQLMPGSGAVASKPAALNARSLGVTGGDAASIDALALIFEAIFDHPGLADGVRAAIVSLQIPVLKLAIQDPGFFTDRQHPARLTLDRMAQMSRGLPRSASLDHPLCARLSQVAAMVRSEPRISVAVFERAVAELEKLAAQREYETQSAAQPYLALVDDLDRRDQALERAARVVDDYCARPLPAEFMNFLRQHWVGVLQDAYWRDGESGQAWQEALALVDDLIWSIEPKQSLDERKQLAALIPTLLRRITAGLAGIGRQLDASSPFLDACFALQTAAMRGKTLPGPAVAAASPPEALPFELPGSGTPAPASLSELSLGGVRLKVVRSPLGAPRPGSRGLPCARGEWLEFPLPGGEMVCGRLAHVSPAGHLLFVNPDWGWGLSLGAGLLEGLLQARQARPCDSGSLFDAAAEQAMRLMAARSA